MPHFLPKLFLAALASYAGFHAPAFACGPFFPATVIDQGDAALLTPLGRSFAASLSKLRLPPPTFPYITLPSPDAERADLVASGANEAALTRHAEIRALLATLAEATRKDPPPAPADREPPGFAGASAEFSLYLRGAHQWLGGHPEGARTTFLSLLDLPPAERRFKSTWAAFSLGQIAAADTMTRLEDIYLPFRPKKRTRATIAREKGLDPLAELIWAQDAATTPEVLATSAAAYVGREYQPDDGKLPLTPIQKIASVDEAFAGARDILAERVSEDAAARQKLRLLYRASAIVSSKVLHGKDASPEAAKFKDYFDWTEPLAKCPSHRLLAMRRAEKELFVMMRITLPDELLALAEGKGTP
jgi:hypothetical protein